MYLYTISLEFVEWICVHAILQTKYIQCINSSCMYMHMHMYMYMYTAHHSNLQQAVVRPQADTTCLAVNVIIIVIVISATRLT